MEKLIVYHNPRCSKSRTAVQYLQEKGVDFDIVEYLKTPLTKDELKELIEKLNIKPEELIRKNESIYKELFKGKNLSDDEWVEAMVKYPKLIERPIVVAKDKAVVARPTEKINDLK